MQFKIDSKIFENFPELNIGVLVAKNVDNTGEGNTGLELINEESSRIKGNVSNSSVEI